MDNTNHKETKNGFEYLMDELFKISKVHNIIYFEYKKSRDKPSRYDDCYEQIDVKIRYR